MNYLAHFLLSFEQEPLIVGNLLGDFVRGRLDHARNSIYPEDIKRGIKLHRHIDSFTDSHHVVDTCRSILPDKFGHYKGVIVDMYFDFFLANHFSEYHKTPLAQFSKNIYQVLKQNHAFIPDTAQPMVESMTKYDWLTHYQYMEGMKRSFLGMSKRFKVLKGIDEADEELAKNKYLYEEQFHIFFPELKQSCIDFLEEN